MSLLATVLCSTAGAQAPAPLKIIDPADGRQIMNNGVGAYRVSDQATAWLREYNRRFTV